MKLLSAILGILFLPGAAENFSRAANASTPAPSDSTRTYGFGGTEEFQDSSAGQDSLGATIARGLELLHGKKYADFLKMFMQPQELIEMTEDETLDELAAEFARDFGAQLLELFQRIRTLKPVMSDKGATATFILPGKGIDGENEFKFVRIGKNWYLDE